MYAVQLALNAIWTPVFFGLYPVIGPAALWSAFAIIVALDVVLLIPYLAWVLYATTLNLAVAVLDP